MCDLVLTGKGGATGDPPHARLARVPTERERPFRARTSRRRRHDRGVRRGDRRRRDVLGLLGLATVVVDVARKTSSLANTIGWKAYKKGDLGGSGRLHRSDVARRELRARLVQPRVQSSREACDLSAARGRPSSRARGARPSFRKARVQGSRLQGCSARGSVAVRLLERARVATRCARSSSPRTCSRAIRSSSSRIVTSDLDRASSPPRVWAADSADAGGPFIAPRDDVAGGTWLGVNRAGVFVGITNRYLGPQGSGRASRAARSSSMRSRSARRARSTTRWRRCRRRDTTVFISSTPTSTTSSPRPRTALTSRSSRSVAASTSLTERSFGAGDDGPRLARIRAAWKRLAPASEGHDAKLDLDRLSQLLTEHDETDLLAATCIHVTGYPLRDTQRRRHRARREARPWRQRGDAEESRMLWAEGPPCTTPFAP